MDRNGELHTPMKQPPIHTEQKDGFFGTEKNIFPQPSQWVLYCAIPAGFCLGAHILSNTHKEYSGFRIFTTQQAHAQHLIITEQ
jgi:hypothetical protein